MKPKKEKKGKKVLSTDEESKRRRQNASTNQYSDPFFTSLYESSRSTSAQSVSRNLVSNLMNFWNNPYNWLSKSSS